MAQIVITLTVPDTFPWAQTPPAELHVSSGRRDYEIDAEAEGYHTTFYTTARTAYVYSGGIEEEGEN